MPRNIHSSYLYLICPASLSEEYSSATGCNPCADHTFCTSQDVFLCSLFGRYFLHLAVHSVSPHLPLSMHPTLLCLRLMLSITWPNASLPQCMSFTTLRILV